jgi:hypothetical protein
MSAGTLRKAAALMRERAEAAEKPHASPWRPMGAGSVVYQMTKRLSGTVAETYPRGGSDQQVATTEHIASWDPAVALAVADWLSNAAYWRTCDECSRSHDLCVAARQSGKRACCPDCAHAKAALAVARAYLGETA